MDNINLLKKYALSYLSKYDSTKKNLERILTNKVMRMKKIEKNEKNHLFKTINQIVISLESGADFIIIPRFQLIRIQK